MNKINERIERAIRIHEALYIMLNTVRNIKTLLNTTNKTKTEERLLQQLHEIQDKIEETLPLTYRIIEEVEQNGKRKQGKN